MKIIDKVYGEFRIDGVLEDLVNSRGVQRLKYIHQGGGSYLVNPKWNVTRYEHSIGTMLLVKLLGGSIEEQIAALLHDISHTAFSHVIDSVLKKENEDYHEEIFETIVEKSEIPEILTRYGYDYKDILYNEFKWTILEKSAPALCADRVDYTLRDLYNYDYISKASIDRFMETLCVSNGEIVIKDISAAEWFVNTYYKEVIDYFMNPLNIYANYKLAELIREALELKVITLEDLLNNDNYVIDKVKNSECDKIIKLLAELNNNVKLVEDDEDYNIYQKNKVRTIDPTVLIEGKRYKASEKSILVKIINENALLKAKKGIYFRIDR